MTTVVDSCGAHEAVRTSEQSHLVGTQHEVALRRDLPTLLIETLLRAGDELI